jgi:hypothetical protein
MDSHAKPHNRMGARTAGLLLVALALLVRPEVVGYNLTPDGQLSGAAKILFIRACEAAALLAGLWLLVRGRSPLPAGGLRAANVLLALAAAVALLGNLLAWRVIDPGRETRERIAVMVESEELLLSLTPDLKKVARSAMNLRLVDHRSLELFADRVEVVDVAGGASEAHVVDALDFEVRERSWPVEDGATTVAREELSMWEPVLSQLEYLEHAKFYFHHGDFASSALDHWVGDVRFSGVARTRTGDLVALHAAQDVHFVKETDGEEDVWRIRRWGLREMHAEETREPLFEEVLDRVLPRAADLEEARRSIHEEKLLAYLKQPEPRTPPHPEFQLPAFDRHPSISIVDVDSDGHDDVYVMARWGPNQLLRNQGDGTFEDVAAEVGLDVDGHCSTGLFADFDNDGDPDLLLGRTLERSRYYLNDGGTFHRRDDLVSVELPYLVSSIAAADYDGDGLLDVYVSTYAGEGLDAARNDPKSWETERFLAKYLSDADAAELFRLGNASENRFTERPGPPNLLLRNAGGGRLEADDALPRFFLNTYQSSWGDFDGDGDADLYVANDFSINFLYENDGSGVFTDVTEREGVADIGFGMGASWGDYDNDGRLDLYVSNMYSKAGRRITAQVPGLDPRFAAMARGNSLFKNLGGGFDKVSGLEDPALLVEAGGWSWGGQFVDLDNNGWLDVYTLSGFYSVPEAVAKPLDL